MCLWIILALLRIRQIIFSITLVNLIGINVIIITSSPIIIATPTEGIDYY